MLEDKQIYTSSNWAKITRKLRSYKNSLQKGWRLIFKPKPKIKYDLTKPLPKISEPTPTQQVQKPIRKSKVKRQLPKIYFRPKHLRFSESGMKIMVYALVATMIGFFLLGIFLSIPSN